MLAKIVKEWLEKAEEDFGFASVGLEHTDFFTQICFHFHQATEKYPKAYIIAKRLKFRPVHNLLELLEICRKRQPRFESLQDSCLFLNPFYIDTRYPVHWPAHYDRENALLAKRHAARVGELVKELLRTT